MLPPCLARLARHALQTRARASRARCAYGLLCSPPHMYTHMHIYTDVVCLWPALLPTASTEPHRASPRFTEPHRDPTEPTRTTAPVPPRRPVAMGAWSAWL